jgi:hypothetical protein
LGFPGFSGFSLVFLWCVSKYFRFFLDFFTGCRCRSQICCKFAPPLLHCHLHSQTHFASRDGRGARHPRSRGSAVAARARFGCPRLESGICPLSWSVSPFGTVCGGCCERARVHEKHSAPFGAHSRLTKCEQTLSPPPRYLSPSCAQTPSTFLNACEPAAALHDAPPSSSSSPFASARVLSLTDRAALMCAFDERLPQWAAKLVPKRCVTACVVASWSWPVWGGWRNLDGKSIESGLA